MSKIKHDLTKKNKEILNAIVEKGLFHRKDIADEFVISLATVSTHLIAIYTATDTHTIAELIYKQYQRTKQKLEKIEEIVTDELNLKFDITGKLKTIKEIIKEE